VDAQTVGEPGAEQFAAASETFKLLADGTRLKILWALLHQEHSVGELAARVGAQPAAVSQHLAKLRAAHLVRARREGNRMYYEADDAHVQSLVDQTLRHATHVVPELLAAPSPEDGQIRTVA
jgi:ArsR family transcriptional regulator, zinc-responsive transcriptional repressor